MTPGNLELNSSGNVLLDADGKRKICGNCCARYYELYKCCDSSASMLWVSENDLGAGVSVEYSGLCYQRGGSATNFSDIPGGETVLVPADFTVNAKCCVCSYCCTPMAANASVTLAGISLQTCYEESPGNLNYLSYGGDAPTLDPNQSGSAAISGCGAMVLSAGSYTAIVTSHGNHPACDSPGASVSGTTSYQISVSKISLTQWRVLATVGFGTARAVVFDAVYTVTSGECGPVSFVVSNGNGAAAGYGGPWYGGTATVVIT